MEYSIELLKSALRDERIAKGQADEYLHGSGMSTKDRKDIAAFEESRRIACERIPDLERALDVLHGNY